MVIGLGIDLIGLVGDTEDTGEIIQQSAQTLTGLRLLMTVLPMIGLILALVFFIRKFRLTDSYALEIHDKLHKGKD